MNGLRRVPPGMAALMYDTLMCAAVCCSVLQRVAACCSVLQRVAIT